MLNIDIKGFSYQYSTNTYTFTFYLTPDGQQKFSQETRRLEFGEISIWVGNDLIQISSITDEVTSNSFMVAFYNKSDSEIQNIASELRRK